MTETNTKRPQVKYKIILTECWPCCWKCQKQNPYEDTNESHLYHDTEIKALDWIIKHNGELV